MSKFKVQGGVMADRAAEIQQYVAT